MDFPKLPPPEAFYSELKGCNTLGKSSEEIAANYAKICQIWRENNMQTFKDWVVYYNNLDVKPFHKALSNMQDKFYDNFSVDMFQV